MKTFYDRVRDSKHSFINKTSFDVQDIIDVGYNLYPLKCRNCGSETEVTFYQYLHDAHCEACGSWQLRVHKSCNR